MDITRQKKNSLLTSRDLGNPAVTHLGWSGLPLLGNPDTRKSGGLSPETGLRQFCFQTVEEKKTFSQTCFVNLVTRGKAPK